jgi:hypothetical protein
LADIIARGMAKNAQINTDNAVKTFGSGSPKGTYTTTTALNAAFPTGTTGIYVVTEDGKWYYWNGTAWTAGGVYQSTSANQMSITDAGNLYTATNVEDALQEVKSTLKTSTIQNSGNITKPVTNLIANGNFENTNSWAAIYSTKTASNNTMSVVGNGANAAAMIQSSTTKTVVTGQRFYYRAKLRVTNSNCTKMTISALGGYGETTVINPVINKWYDVSSVAISGGNGTYALMVIKHEYADAATALNKVLEIQNAMVFDLSVDIGLGTSPDLHLLDEMMVLNGNVYWEGTSTVIVKNAISDINSQFAQVEEDRQQIKIYNIQNADL